MGDLEGVAGGRGLVLDCWECHRHRQWGEEEVRVDTIVKRVRKQRRKMDEGVEMKRVGK